MLRLIGYPSDNRSGRKWVVSGHNRRRTCDHLHLNIPSFLAFVPAKKRAAIFLYILQQPLPSMHNLILHWFVTLELVESGEVRVCSYSLSDVMLKYVHFVIGTRTDQRNTAKLSLDTVLTENDAEPKRPVCFNSTRQRHCVPSNRVVGISWHFNCISLSNDFRKVTVITYFVFVLLFVLCQ